MRIREDDQGTIGDQSQWTEDQTLFSGNDPNQGRDA
jgi:hypothetical protein